MGVGVSRDPSDWRTADVRTITRAVDSLTSFTWIKVVVFKAEKKSHGLQQGGLNTVVEG